MELLVFETLKLDFCAINNIQTTHSVFLFFFSNAVTRIYNMVVARNSRIWGIICYCVHFVKSKSFIYGSVN